MTMLAPKFSDRGQVQGEGRRLEGSLPGPPQGDLKKATPFLPVGWKKADLETLREYYVNILVPDYDRPNDLHWKGWRRAQFVLELEMWINQREEQRKNDPLSDLPEGNPLCDACGIPPHGEDKSPDEGGVLRLPQVPFLRVHPSNELWRQADGNGSEGVCQTKTGVVPKMKSKRGQVRQGGYASASDGSWMPVGPQYVDADSEDDKEKNINVNLTSEEAALIEKMRAEKVAKETPQEIL